MKKLYKSEKEQKFAIGSKVFIQKDLPSCMSHFLSGCNAIVMCTYSQRYGGNDNKSYTLMLLDNNDTSMGTSAWYKEDQLTLVEAL